MDEKLSRAILTWRRSTDEPLTVYFNGVTQEVTARTTNRLEGQIEIDLGKANNANLLELIVLMAHEVGHVIGLSDSLITDSKIIEIMLNEPELSAIAEVINSKTVGIDFYSKPGLQEWANEGIRDLKAQLVLARRQSSLQGEIEILLKGFRNFQNSSPAEYFPLLAPTVVAAEGDAEVFEVGTFKAQVLRRYYSFAIADLERLKSQNSSASSWVEMILKRSQRLSFSARIPKEEIHILRRSLERVLLVLSVQPISATSLNSCLENQVQSILDEEIELEDEKVKLDYLRAKLREMRSLISHGSCS
jgi:hypothetical protein